MNLSDTSRHVQPKAIQEILFKSSESGRNTRLHDDESKIKIHHEYKKGQAFYNIINEWNKTKTDHRMAGNLWSLKKMLKDSVLEELNICTRKNCTTCELDSKWNYERYMRRRWGEWSGKNNQSNEPTTSTKEESRSHPPHLPSHHKPTPIPPPTLPPALTNSHQSFSMTDMGKMISSERRDVVRRNTTTRCQIHATYHADQNTD